MSLGRQIFGRLFNALGGKIRGSEDFWARARGNIRDLRSMIYAFGSFLCAGALFQRYVVEKGHSQGISMFPTMLEESPLTLTSKRHMHGKGMGPGDIVNFASPIFRDGMAGKRIIGRENDFVVLDPSQAPSVGGAAVPGITDWRSESEAAVPGITDWRSESEAAAGVELKKEREEPMMIEVPTGHVWVVGDNLSRSRDSRFYGAVPMALVRGKQVLHTTGRWRDGGWHWTGGEQLTRIPKEMEEEYFRNLGRW